MIKISQILIYTFCFLNFFYGYSQDPYEKIYSGEGTYYGGIAGSAGGNCGLPVELGDYFHCAMNNVEYDGSNACGSCVTVTGVKGSITLKVVDRCPECKSGDIDMTLEAFDKIANLTDGRVPITWKYTACDTNDDGIKIVFKDGSSEFWTGIQFRNLEHAIINLEYQDESTDDWVSINRELYNYFVAPDGISSPMNLKLTSVLGEEIIFEDVTLDTSKEISTDQQFTVPDGAEVISDGDGDEDISDTDSITYNILTPDNSSIASIIIPKELVNIKEALLYNMLGQTIKIKASIENENIIRINMDDILAGFYVIRFVDDDNLTITKKIIIF